MALSELQGCGWVPAGPRETPDEAVEVGGPQSWRLTSMVRESPRKSSEA